MVCRGLLGPGFHAFPAPQNVMNGLSPSGKETAKTGKNYRSLKRLVCAWVKGLLRSHRFAHIRQAGEMKIPLYSPLQKGTWGDFPGLSLARLGLAIHSAPSKTPEAKQCLCRKCLLFKQVPRP